MPFQIQRIYRHGYDAHEAGSFVRFILMSMKEVPDYLIDNISFAIMHDPVVVRLPRYTLPLPSSPIRPRLTQPTD